MISIDNGECTQIPQPTYENISQNETAVLFLNAVKKSNINSAIKLLKKYPNLDINAQDEHGNTALHILASFFSSYDNQKKLCEEIMLNENINLDIQNKRGNTPLHLAVFFGNWVITEIFLVNGSGNSLNIKNNYDNTPVALAIYHGRTELLKRLMKDKRIDMSIKDNYGNNYLHISARARRGSKQSFSNIVDDGRVDINGENNCQLTPLDIALYFQQSTNVSALLKDSKTKVNAKDKDGDTPLNRVILKVAKNEEIISKGGKNAFKAEADNKNFKPLIVMLINAGAMTDIENNDGENSQDLAKKLKDQTIIKKLQATPEST